MATTDWGFAFSPAPSTSASTHSAFSGASPADSTSTTSSTPAGRRRVACARCRRLREKCEWDQGVQGCRRCHTKGASCSGPVIPLPRTQTRTSLRPSVALVTHHQPWAPYLTAAGQPRLLGPSSSEGSLNAIGRASALRAELVNLYNASWPIQQSLLPATVFDDLISGPRDQAHKAFLSICTALGARSSSNPEIVQQLGPPLSTVDDDPAGLAVPGGFSQWGQRRHGACVALGRRAAADAAVLLQARPTFRALKVAITLHKLHATLKSEYRDRRAFLEETVRMWRALVVDPGTTQEELGMLLHSFGPGMMLRDHVYAISDGTPSIFTTTERAIIANANPILHTEKYFELPDCSATGGLVVFEEEPSYRLFVRAWLWLMYSLGLIFANGPLTQFGPSQIGQLRQLWAYTEDTVTKLSHKREQVRALPPGAVVVLSQWRGSWRPAEPKQHAIVLLNEVISELSDSDTIVHVRFQAELAAGRLDGADQAVAAVAAEARERCRRVIKRVARTITDWMPAPSKHATWANVFHGLANVPDWVALALARFGEADGPLARGDELSVDEVELLVRGLRVGSFSQSTLVVPLRELERGLEELRKAEAASELTGSESLAFSLEDFLVGLDHDQA